VSLSSLPTGQLPLPKMRDDLPASESGCGAAGRYEASPRWLHASAGTFLHAGQALAAAAARKLQEFPGLTTEVRLICSDRRQANQPSTARLFSQNSGNLRATSARGGQMRWRGGWVVQDQRCCCAPPIYSAELCVSREI